jgi:hypothetical protein
MNIYLINQKNKDKIGDIKKGVGKMDRNIDVTEGKYISNLVRQACNARSDQKTASRTLERIDAEQERSRKAFTDKQDAEYEQAQKEFMEAEKIYTDCVAELADIIICYPELHILEKLKEAFKRTEEKERTDEKHQGRRLIETLEEIVNETFKEIDKQVGER